MTLLIESALKVTAIVLAGLVATLMARRRSAAIRHWLIATTCVAAAAIPLLQVALPAWHVAIDASSYMAAAPATVAGAAIPSPAGSATGAAASLVKTAPAPDSTEPWLMRALMPIWLTGALLSLAVLGIGGAHLMWLASRARTITAGPWRAICDEYAAHYGITRRVTLLQSDHPTLLVTWGLRAPRIVLPVGAGRWPERRIRAILAHELAHVQRGDSPVLLLAELLRAGHWFNPAVWIARSRLRRESEHACDDAAIGCGIDAAEYAQHLLDVARIMRVRRHTWWPAPALVGTSFFERRIKAMLNRTVSRTPAPRSFRVAAVAAMFVLAVAVAAAQTGFARVSGTIMDANNGYVPNARIVLTHLATNTKHEMRANATGAYDFVGLVAGDYQLEAEAVGFATYREALTISPAQAMTRAVILQVGTLEETITVKDDGGTSAPSLAKRVAAPAAKRCEPSAAGGRILPPVKIADLRPRYPQNLRDQSAGGLVQLQVVIGPDGLVKSVDVTSTPNQEMADAAVDAVRQWEYTPTLLNCVAIDVHMGVLVNFMARQQ